MFWLRHCVSLGCVYNAFVKVIGANTKNNYKAVTHSADDEGPRSELRGTWYFSPPFVVERQEYLRIRAVDVDLIKSRTVVVRGGYGEPVMEDVLVSKGTQLRVYAPGEVAAELLTGLLDLAQGKLSPTGFADRFGYMGYNTLVPSNNRCKGEPLHWLFAHAHTLFVAFKVINLLKQARGSETGRKKLEEYIRNKLPYGPYVHEAWIFQVPALRGSAGSPIMAANNVLRYLLNPNIEAVGRQLMMDRTELRNIFVFRTPIQVAYWYLASLIGKQTLRQCRECGRVFIDERSNVKFCPPVPPKTISPCKSRFNVRKMRVRQKEGLRKRKSHGRMEDPS